MAEISLCRFLLYSRSKLKNDPKNKKGGGDDAEGGEHREEHGFHRVPIGLCPILRCMAGTVVAKIRITLIAGFSAVELIFLRLFLA